MEQWNHGFKRQKDKTALLFGKKFHHSNIPVFHYSTIPE
jgi:hypothetical protein